MRFKSLLNVFRHTSKVDVKTISCLVSDIVTMVKVFYAGLSNVSWSWWLFINEGSRFFILLSLFKMACVSLVKAGFVLLDLIHIGFEFVVKTMSCGQTNEVPRIPKSKSNSLNFVIEAKLFFGDNSQRITQIVVT